MRRLLALAVGGLGLGALIRRRRRRAPVEPQTSLADELREKLVESRAAQTEVAPAEESDVAARTRAAVARRALVARFELPTFGQHFLDAHPPRRPDRGRLAGVVRVRERAA